MKIIEIEAFPMKLLAIPLIEIIKSSDKLFHNLLSNFKLCFPLTACGKSGDSLDLSSLHEKFQ